MRAIALSGSFPKSPTEFATATPVEEGGPAVSAPDPRPCICKEPPHPAGYALGREVVGTYQDHYREEAKPAHQIFFEEK